ncbi:MAG: amino acid ABC transporter permease [Rhodoluna sp.]|nr:amino acid ABC transporter permease [Rhodoluna sp.]
MAEQTDLSDDVVAVPLRHPWRWISGGMATLLLLSFIWAVYSAKSIQHELVTKFLFDPRILIGMAVTVVVTVICMFIATILATLLAVMKLSDNPLQRLLATGFIEFFRGTPLLLQIVFWGYLGIIFPQLILGVPYTEIVFLSGKTSDLIPAIVAGIIALSLNEAAYSAEIVRAGILAVDSGQVEAAKSLGMSSPYTMRRIVLPQAMRVIIPPMGNEFISMLKNTSLLQVIAVAELYTAASTISAANLAQIELLVVSGFWYLIMTTVLGIPQRALERKYGKGFANVGGRSAPRAFKVGRR